jgi:hypothetical protein
MKRVGQWAIGIGLFVTMGFLTIEAGYANDADHAHQCALATLRYPDLVAARDAGS